MVVVVQPVRTSDCGSEGRGFESHHPPCKRVSVFETLFFSCLVSFWLPKVFYTSGTIIQRNAGYLKFLKDDDFTQHFARKQTFSKSIMFIT